jgi:hypothetical protein
MREMIPQGRSSGATVARIEARLGVLETVGDQPMNIRPRKRVRLAVVALVAVVAAALAFSGCFYLSARAAKRSAAEFCDEIAVGSDIAAAAERARQRKILFGTGSQYNFIFPTITGFDKAVCTASVDGSGKVLAKDWQMEFD